MIKAGEASGKLDIFLVKLTEILERREDIRRKIKSASFYPKILFFVAGRHHSVYAYKSCSQFLKKCMEVWVFLCLDLLK